MRKLSVYCKTFNALYFPFCSQTGVSKSLARFYTSRSTWNGNKQLQHCLPTITSFAQVPYCSCSSRSYGFPNGSSLFTPSVSIRHYVTAPENDKSLPESKPPTLYQRFKAMYRDYWYVLLPVHLVTSAAWFGGFYYMASSGVDIVSLLENLNVSEKVINPFRNGHSTTGYLAISYALYKIATPLRYTVTLGGTTVSINYLKTWGYIKPVPSKEKLKEIYEDRKEMFKEKGQTLKDNMIQTFKPAAANIPNQVRFPIGCFLDPYTFQVLGTSNQKQYSTKTDEDKSERQRSGLQRLKDLFKEYWFVVVPVHLVTTCFWIAGFYCVAASCFVFLFIYYCKVNLDVEGPDYAILDSERPCRNKFGYWIECCFVFLFIYYCKVNLDVEGPDYAILDSERPCRNKFGYWIEWWYNTFHQIFEKVGFNQALCQKRIKLSRFTSIKQKLGRVK